MFTPAIRATNVSPVADPSRRTRLVSFCCLGQVSANANTTPCPFALKGAASSVNQPTWMLRLLMDSKGFRQPPQGPHSRNSLEFSTCRIFGIRSLGPAAQSAPGSLFRELFRHLPDSLLGAPNRPLQRPRGGFFDPFGGLFGA